jgi:hypothetical protein
MDNPEKLTTFGTQDTLRRIKLKRWTTRTPKTVVNTDAREGQTVHVSYNSYSQYVLDTTMRKQT